MRITAPNLDGNLEEVALDNPIDGLEAIGRWLASAAPEPWAEITIDFEIIEIDDVAEDCITYKPRGHGGEDLKQFFIDDTRFSGCFFALAKITKRDGQGHFKKCQYVLSEDGSYKCDFQY